MTTRAKKYTIAHTRTHLTDVLNQASYGKERIEILRRNKPIAYIVPVEDVEMLEKIEDMTDIEEAEARKNEPTIDLKELKEELGL
ncbi:MAG: type II toxin-antitoxin system Phd/YefM family antitoxin [bacterium]